MTYRLDKPNSCLVQREEKPDPEFYLKKENYERALHDYNNPPTLTLLSIPEGWVHGQVVDGKDVKLQYQYFDNFIGEPEWQDCPEKFYEQTGVNCRRILAIPILPAQEGKEDARAYDHDELYIMEAYHSQFTTPSTTVEQASKEMDKAIKCLALELPELVWNDVSRIWENYKSVLAGAALASTPCNDWISVDSGLPEYGELVWVFNPKAVVKQYSIFFMPFAGAEEIGVFTNGGTMNDTDVTHWMKLPAPPAKQ